MERIVVEAESRDVFGKGAARKLRARGLIPAVVYGEQGGVVPVTIDPKELIRILRSHSGVNTIFDLRLKGGKNGDTVMVREYQLEPVTHTLLHADLIRVSMDHAMTVTVPIELVGTPVGVKQEGGMLDFVTRAVEVSCLPSDIPERIPVDVTGLSLGRLVRSGELTLPDRVTLESEPETVIVHVLAPRAEAEEEEEAAALVEGEGAEPEVIKKGKEEGEEAPEEPTSE